MSENDETAFAAMVATHQRALHRYARRRVGPDDAADVVAEVFAAAWRHRERLPDPVEPWLFRTAWHVLLHQFRAARRRASLDARLQLEHGRDAGTGGHADGDARVRAALSRLRPIDQELLRLAYWEDFDAARIAEIVGGSPQAVRVRLHRARRRLAAHLPELADRADELSRLSAFEAQEQTS